MMNAAESFYKLNPWFSAIPSIYGTVGTKGIHICFEIYDIAFEVY
jgi:hypothetical protein